jgi:hypothetical protein
VEGRVEGRVEAIRIIQTQSQNGELTRIKKIAWRKDRDKVSVEVYLQTSDMLTDAVGDNGWLVIFFIRMREEYQKVREKFC